MSDKFSYFDFLMYLLPGSALFLELLGAILLIWPKTLEGIEILGEGGLFASVLFVLISFILGNSIQIIANTIPQYLLKIFFWGGYWPSQLAILDNSDIFTESELKKIKERLIKIKVLKDAELQFLKLSIKRKYCFCIESIPPNKKEDLKKATEISQYSFNYIRYSILGTEAANKVQSSEAQYQFCRGMFTTFAIGSLLFFFMILMDIGNDIAPPSTILLSFLAILFFWRTRGVGKGWTIVVFRSVFSIKEDEEPNKQNTTNPNTPTNTDQPPKTNIQEAATSTPIPNTKKNKKK